MTRGALAGVAFAAALAVSAAPALAEDVRVGTHLYATELTPPGPRNAGGVFEMEIDTEYGEVCYTLSVSGVSRPRGAYIHSGKRGESGPELLALDLTGARNTICMSADAEALRAIANDPAGHYISVFSQQYPAGAVRGQLAVR